MRASITVCLFVFTCLLPLSAESLPSVFPEARRLYYAGINGDSEASRKSAKLLEELAQSHPSDPLIQAYFGSTRLLESARTFAVWKKGRLAKEGLTMLDSAVTAAPEQLEVRFVRAMTTFHLPGFFKREEQSRDDFARLAPQVEAAAQQGRIDRNIAAAALYHHGVFLDRKSDTAGARKAWEAATRIGPDTRAGRDAAKRLK